MLQMTSPARALRKALLFVSVALSTNVDAALSLHPQGGALMLPQNTSNPENTPSFLGNDSSLVARPRMECLGRQYGMDLALKHCQEAIQGIAESFPAQLDKRVRFENGHSGNAAVRLPYRSIASKHSFRIHCGTQPDKVLI